MVTVWPLSFEEHEKYLKYRNNKGLITFNTDYLTPSKLKYLLAFYLHSYN